MGTKQKRIVATIEARMNSSRLPGKVLLPALNRSMICHLIDRLKRVPSLNKIVLATTKNKSDDVLEEVAKQENIQFYRGSEENVLLRVIEAADSANADIVVQITGDCPIIDPDLVEQTIRVFLKNNAVVFCSNSFFSSYPDGMDTSVVCLKALKQSYKMTNDPLDREHVVRYIVNNPNIFPHVYLIAPPSQHWPGLGLTLDEPEDYELIRHLIEKIGVKNQFFGCSEIIKYIKENPNLLNINKMVVRKDPRPN